MPATLQEALTARLDRLAPVREVIQVAALLGRIFDADVVRAATSLGDGELQRALADLQEAGLVYRRAQSPKAFEFKHALIQEAALTTLVRQRRRHLHGRIVAALERTRPEIPERQPEVLAHHVQESGDDRRACDLWRAAGDLAIKRSANPEAVKHFTTAIEALKRLSAAGTSPSASADIGVPVRQELDLQIALGSALRVTKGWAAREVETAYTRAVELCHRVGDEPSLFQALRGLWDVYEVRAELQTARERAEQLLTLAERQQHSIVVMEAHYALGETLVCQGEFGPARTHLKQGLGLYDPTPRRAQAFQHGECDVSVACRQFLGWTLWFLGYPEQALRTAQDALAWAREIEHPFSVVHALAAVTWLRHFRREGRGTIEGADALMTVAAERGFALWSAWGALFRGWAMAAEGRSEEGIAQMHQGLAAYQATGAEFGRPYYRALLVEASRTLGQADEGLVVLTDALNLVHRTGELRWEAELHRHKGELPLAQSHENAQTAEASFLQAIDVARAQQAKSLELRAATSLSRLWQRQGRRSDARRALAEVYDWFTEGFDTADLKDARALLENLS